MRPNRSPEGYPQGHERRAGLSPVGGDSEAYLELWRKCRARARSGLTIELGKLQAEILELHDDLARVVGAPQLRAGAWSDGTGQSLDHERLAAAEFDALTGSPAVRDLRIARGSSLLEVVLAGTGAHGGSPDSGDGSTTTLVIDLIANKMIEPSLDAPDRPMHEVRNPVQTRFDLFRRLAASLLVSVGDIAGAAGVLAWADDGRAGPSAVCRSAEIRAEYVRRRISTLGSADDAINGYADLDQRLDWIKRSMDKRARGVADLERELNALAQAGFRKSEDVRREFELIGQLPGVRDVAVDESSVVVHTLPISVGDTDGPRYEVGRFRIEIIPGEGVLMHNVDPSQRSARGRYDHPHVMCGRACTGELSAWMAIRLSACDFLSVVKRALEFLHSYDAASAYAPAQEWQAKRSEPETIGVAYHLARKDRNPDQA